MIRGVVKQGVIQPVEPLPSHWQDGREVVVEDVEKLVAKASEEFDNWSADMSALTAELDDPQEWQCIEAALAEADRQAKLLVRREMGLS